MRTRLMFLAVAVAAIAALAFGGATLASTAGPAAAREDTPSPSLTPSDAGQPRAEAADSEPATDADADAQAKDCAAANPPVVGDNVQYDDATGVCTLDTAPGAAAASDGAGQTGEH